MTLQGEDKNENGYLTMEMLRLLNDCMETFNAIKTALNLLCLLRLWTDLLYTALGGKIHVLQMRWKMLEI